MQMIASNFVVAAIMFISKICDTKADCSWNGADSCLVDCTINVPNTVGTDIENLLAQREHCHDKFELRLRKLPYPNGTINLFWFNADVKVVSLEVNLDGVKTLSTDAFNSDAFQTVKKLLLVSFKVPLIVKGAFNGLNALEIINIKGAQNVSRIEAGVLDNIKELKEFTFEEAAKSYDLNINGLTGSAELSKLEYVKIKYNLLNSIRKSTFIGLRNVKRLDLSSCYIKSIDDNSFDPISETIERLDLSSNALTTVTYGVFSMVLPNIKTIKINGNNWNCVCDLMAFRLFIEAYQQKFTGGYDCASPTYCQISNILESDCFDTCEIPTTTTLAATSAPSTTTTSPNTNLIKECPKDLASSDSISIKRPIGYMAISENEYGETNLDIESEQDAKSLVVIRFDNKQNSSVISNGNGVNCFSRSDATSIPINDMESDVIYSYCLMRKTSTSVSPLDCISYTIRQDQMNPAWLPESSKTLTIALVVAFLLLNIVFGITTALCFMRHNPFSNQQPKNSSDSKDALSYGADRNITDKSSNIYTRNAIVADIYGHNDAFKCPPLPERPPKIYEDPIYAYVVEAK